MKIMICILMILLTFQIKGQDSDTLYATISYEKQFLKKGRFEINAWTNYSYWWDFENGITIYINLKRNKKNAKPNRNISNWNRSDTLFWYKNYPKSLQLLDYSKRY